MGQEYMQACIYVWQAIHIGHFFTNHKVIGEDVEKITSVQQQSVLVLRLFFPGFF